MIRMFNLLASAIGQAWCQLMHPDPMWPVKGEYQCRICQRKFRVAWEQPASLEQAKPAQRSSAESIAPAASQTC